MNPSRVTATLAVFAALVVCAGASGNGASLPLQQVARVALPGPSNRFDYTSIDPTTNRLYIAHMNASQLLTFDLKSRKVVRTIDVAGVHGVIAVPELGRVFASATNDHQAVTIDAKTGRVVASAPAGSYPDGLVYDPVERHVFVSDEAGGVETVLNAKGARIATISLGGDAGNVQYDAGSRHILVDVQTRDEIAVIDPRTNKLIRRIPVHCQSDHSLYVDSRRAAGLRGLRRRCQAPDARPANDEGHPDSRASAATRMCSRSTRQPAPLCRGRERRRGRLCRARAHAHQARPVAPGLGSAHGRRRFASHLVYFPLEAGGNGRPQLLIMKPAG